MWGFAPPPFHIPLYNVFTSEENKKALWSDIYDEMEGGWLDRETFSWRDNVFVIVIFRLIKLDNSLNVSSATSVIGSISIANLVRTIENRSVFLGQLPAFWNIWTRKNVQGWWLRAHYLSQIKRQVVLDDIRHDLYIRLALFLLPNVTKHILSKF